MSRGREVVDSVEGDLFAVATMLTGIDVEDLGADDRDGAGPDARATASWQATLMAGCLWKAAIVVIDGLFDDVIVLAAADDHPVGDAMAGLSVIGQLPHETPRRWTVPDRRHLLWHPCARRSQPSGLFREAPGRRFGDLANACRR